MDIRRWGMAVEINSNSAVGRASSCDTVSGGFAVGVLLVLGGGACYGVLATFVRLAYAQGFTPAEVLTAQFIIGILALGSLTFAIPAARASMRDPALTPKALTALILGSSSIGLTGSFYYLSVIHASVSISVVLLMQSVWMGIALDAALSRRLPEPAKLVATALVLSGTVVATNVLSTEVSVSPLGYVFGVLAALSYTAVIWVSKHLSVNLHPISRSFYMMIGGALAAFVIALPQFAGDFHWTVFWRWGWMALFGTILPPLLFAKGVPLTSVSLAAILSSIELPAAIATASAVLAENFSLVQWSGVAVIIIAIILANAGSTQTEAIIPSSSDCP